jgi:hypothetical protein
MYADGIGYGHICSHLNQFCKPKRSKSWNRSTVQTILSNPIYIGLIKWQQRKTVKLVEGGEVVRGYAYRKDCPLYQGRHTPIISEELWNAVKARREAHDIPRVKTCTHLRNPLAGLISCECGYTMVLYAPVNNTAPRLYCSNKTTCNSSSCTYAEMEDIVANILRQSVSDFELKISAGEDDRTNEKVAFLDQLKRRLAALDEKETGIWEKYAEGMPKRIFETLIAELTDERSRIETMIAEAEKEKPVHYSELITTFHAALECLDSDESAQKKNALLKNANENPSLLDTLDIWDEKIAFAGAEIISDRIDYIKKLKSKATDIYNGISGEKEELDIKYLSNIRYESEEKNDIARIYFESLKKHRPNDLYLKSTTCGPHRDDIEILINNISARKFGSQGQQRSASLSLKLGEAEIIKDLKFS